ncbi:hypothetical protein PO909_015933, partial [Leuciscus waleckii]
SFLLPGEEISQTVEQAISGDFIGRLIVQPSGDAEANMILMTLPVTATHYLDSTNQWEAVGMNRRSEAINHINTGYQRQLSYRKSDGSFAAWVHRPSSTWLTAYVAKVFTMANNFAAIQEDVLCSALKWLVLHKQLADGSFKEDSAVTHGEMVGDVRGKDADVSLTAFVVIAMQEGREICAGSVGVYCRLTGNKGMFWKLHRLPSSHPIPFLHFLSLFSMHTSIPVDSAALDKSMEVSSASRMTWVEMLLCL